MNRQDVAQAYKQFRSNISMAVEKEEKLLTAVDHADFVDKLKDKSGFLRQSFMVE